MTSQLRLQNYKLATIPQEAYCILLRKSLEPFISFPFFLPILILTTKLCHLVNITVIDIKYIIFLLSVTFFL